MSESSMSLTTDAAPEYGASEHYLGEKGREYFAWQSGGGGFAARIFAHTFRDSVKPGDTIIDFGCGGGFLLKELGCRERIGVEINPVAREHAQSLGICCFATIDEIPDSVADVVISNHALEHVPFPIGALRELRQKLKPDGLLVLCVPINNWRHDRRYDPNDLNHHLHTWTPQLLGNTLSDAGYQVVDVRARIYAWPNGWTVACYGRLPYWMFRKICYWYGLVTGRGWEVLAVARPRP